jgi:hypothetical protein
LDRVEPAAGEECFVLMGLIIILFILVLGISEGISLTHLSGRAEVDCISACESSVQHLVQSNYYFPTYLFNMSCHGEVDTKPIPLHLLYGDLLQRCNDIETKPSVERESKRARHVDRGNAPCLDACPIDHDHVDAGMSGTGATDETQQLGFYTDIVGQTVQKDHDTSYFISDTQSSSESHGRSHIHERRSVSSLELHKVAVQSSSASFNISVPVFASSVDMSVSSILSTQPVTDCSDQLTQDLSDIMMAATQAPCPTGAEASDSRSSTPKRSGDRDLDALISPSDPKRSKQAAETAEAGNPSWPSEAPPWITQMMWQSGEQALIGI